jgi:hypothetical protein
MPPTTSTAAAPGILILPYGRQPYLLDVTVAAVVGLFLPVFLVLNGGSLVYLSAWIALAAVTALVVLAYGLEAFVRPSMAVLDMATGNLSFMPVRGNLQRKAVPDFQMQHFEGIGFVKSDCFYRTGLYDVLASTEYDASEYLAQGVSLDTAEKTCKAVAERFGLENKGYLGS